jgi:flagellar motor switch protein FliG
MGVYTRFKKDPEGLRKLVMLLETTPAARRQKMIDVGMEEDPIYTQKALELMMNFQDIIKLPDLELAEVVAAAQVKSLSLAIHAAPQEVKDRFLKNAKPQIAAEMRENFGMTVGPKEIGAGQLKLIEVARGLERRGLVKTKKIP